MPGAKGDVAVLGPIDDELVGVLELLGVVTRSREVHQHLVTGLDVHAVVLDVGLGDPSHGDRRVVAQELFDGDREQLRFIEQTLQIVRIRAEMPQRRADRTPGRVDACDDQQVGDANDDLGRDVGGPRRRAP